MNKKNERGNRDLLITFTCTIQYNTNSRRSHHILYLFLFPILFRRFFFFCNKTLELEVRTENEEPD